MQAQKIITKLTPEKKALIDLEGFELPKCRRVAAYARVSTDDEEQQSSYEAQVDYYTQRIQGNPEWIFVEVYTDEGITGTSTKKREGFNRMVADALDGKIDLIITKSISRFARNTVDSLVTVRQLKEKGCEVFFEKENIYTLDGKGEVLITIMSSLAQEESRSISENVSWGKRKAFADGKISMPYKRFLGYQKGEDGTPEVVPEQAETVRWIYRSFLDGMTVSGIAAKLSRQGILSPSGKKTWPASTVESILTNEKYKGEALLQKTFVTDFLTKKSKVNNGEVPQYHVQNSHPAIVSREVHDLVQEELRRRKATGPKSGMNCFSSRIVCGDCGGYYGSKVWHSNDPYRRVIWQCNRKFKNEKKCETPHLNEEMLKKAFVKAFNGQIQNKEEIIAAYDEVLAVFADTSDLDRQEKKATAQWSESHEEMKGLVRQNASMVVDQGEYRRRQEMLSQRYEAAKAKLVWIEQQRQEWRNRQHRIEAFVQALRERKDLLHDFDEGLFNAVMESVTVGKDGGLAFLFRDGRLVEWER
ncbi:MAG: recombinase family protein [Candidatus Limiplasma sp.]|nr:recombinase family protein [Candidatus Limiplasma sp.]